MVIYDQDGLERFPEKVFLGAGTGIALFRREEDAVDPEYDNTVDFMVICEDGDQWFETTDTISMFWATDLARTLAEAIGWVEANCELDVGGIQKFKD